MPTRRNLLKTGAAFAGVAAFAPLHAYAFQKPGAQIKVFDVLKYGAAGDGVTLDSAAFQRAIDEAAAYAGKAQVLVRGGKKFLVSTRREDYLGGLSGSVSGDAIANALGGVIIADHAQGLRISGNGNIQGRA